MKRVFYLFLLWVLVVPAQSFAQHDLADPELIYLTHLIDDTSRKPLIKARSLAKIISFESKKYGIDPLLVVSVIKVESEFKFRAMSEKGARGLMQVMPRTGRALASQLKWKGHQDWDLFLPAKSIRLGVRYLSEMKDRFRQNRVLLLTAYNFGPTAVRKMERKRTLASRHFKYARKVLRHYDFLVRRREYWENKYSKYLEAKAYQASQKISGSNAWEVRAVDVFHPRGGSWQGHR